MPATATRRRSRPALTAQLNTRLDASVKAQAEEAFFEVGVSSSQVVRAVFEKAARRGKDLEEVCALLSDHEEPQPVTSAVLDQLSEEDLASLYPAYRSLQSTFALVERNIRMHASSPARLDAQPVDARSWKELREEAYDARAIERGWLLDA